MSCAIEHDTPIILPGKEVAPSDVLQEDLAASSSPKDGPEDPEASSTEHEAVSYTHLTLPTILRV